MFPLDVRHYPAGRGRLLERARSIAEAAPDLSGRLLASTSGYGVAI